MTPDILQHTEVLTLSLVPTLEQLITGTVMEAQVRISDMTSGMEPGSLTMEKDGCLLIFTANWQGILSTRKGKKFSTQFSLNEIIHDVPKMCR